MSLVVTGASWCLAALAGWVLLFAGPLSHLQEQHAQSQLYAQFRHELARETAPLGGEIQVGRPVAVLTSDRAQLQGAVVVEGTSARELEAGPGHLRTSALPGQAGTAVLLGRSVLFGDPFSDIGRLRSGDDITVTTQQGRFSYRVLGVRHVGDLLPATPTATEGRLVLVSSEGQGWRSSWAPSRQVFVDAALTGSVAPTPPGRPTAVSAAELPMSSDMSRLPLVVVGLQLLLVVTVFVLWIAAGGSRRRAWLLGVPALVAALWYVTETASALVPNIT